MWSVLCCFVIKPIILQGNDSAPRLLPPDHPDPPPLLAVRDASPLNLRGQHRVDHAQRQHQTLYEDTQPDLEPVEGRCLCQDGCAAACTAAALAAAAAAAAAAATDLAAAFQPACCRLLNPLCAQCLHQQQRLPPQPCKGALSRHHNHHKRPQRPGVPLLLLGSAGTDCGMQLADTLTADDAAGCMEQPRHTCGCVLLHPLLGTAGHVIVLLLQRASHRSRSLQKQRTSKATQLQRSAQHAQCNSPRGPAVDQHHAVVEPGMDEGGLLTDAGDAAE